MPVASHPQPPSPSLCVLFFWSICEEGEEKSEFPKNPIVLRNRNLSLSIETQRLFLSHLLLSCYQRKHYETLLKRPLFLYFYSQS